MFRNGSRWMKLDCHLHTIGGQYGLTNLKYDKEIRDFNNDFISKLENEDVDIGFITNHNEFFLEDFKKLDKLATRKNIYLYPGVELNIKLGHSSIHTLVIFDKEWIYNKSNKNYIEEFLIAAFFEEDDRSKRTSKTLKEIVDLLDSKNKDYFIICAHVNDDKGIMKELSIDRIKDKFNNDKIKSRILGFQKVRNYASDSIAKENKIRKLEEALGFNLAYLEGSDPKTISEVGKMSSDGCYIKIGENSFKAIKFALTNHEERVICNRAIVEKNAITEGDIKNKQNNIQQKHKFTICFEDKFQEKIIDKHNKLVNDKKINIKNDKVYLHSIEYVGGKLDGETLYFSKGLNSIIGIRGSGKSAVIESIRYCLDIEKLDNENNSDVEYKDGLIHYILESGGKVICKIYSGKDKYRVVRNYGGSPVVYKKNSLEEYDRTPLSPENILQNPLYFGQKDLTTNKENYEIKLINKLITEDLKIVNSEISKKEKDINEFIKEYYNLIELEKEKVELEDQLNVYKYEKEKYKELNIEEKIQAERDLNLDYSSYKKLIMDINKENTLSKESFKNIKSYLKLELKSTKYKDKIKENIKLLEENIEFINTHINCNEEIMNNMNNILKDIEEEKKENEEIFSEVKRDITKDISEKFPNSDFNIDEVIEIDQKINHTKNNLTNIEKKLSLKTELLNKINEEILELNNYYEEKERLYYETKNKINNNDIDIRLEISNDGNIESFIEKSKRVFNRSSLREATVIRPLCEEFNNFYDIFIDIHINSMSRINKLNIGDSNIYKLEEYFNQNYEEWFSLVKEPKFSIFYRGKNINKHSIGQKASAIILFILTQEQNRLIIIDQPEDDLDNKVIYNELIKTILKKKRKIQFIFSTHNANIPVLGDSDNVVVMDYLKSEKISNQQGSIDKDNIQSSIVEIMEGGEEAFNRRTDIYTIWQI